MRFNIRIIFSVLLLLVLTACTGKPPPFEERVSAPPDTLAGVIEPLDQIDIYREGTHGLRTETGELILIQSSTINLNRYLGKGVTLQGEPAVSLGNDRPVFNVFNVVSSEEDAEEEAQTDEDKRKESKETRKGPPCGGVKKLQCGEGFLCELEGSQENATGVCLPIQKENQDPVCPFIPPPDCEHYKPGALSINDCPTRFICVEKEEKEEGEEIEEEDSNDLGRVMDTITKYKNELFEVAHPKLIQFEASEEASLIAVVYEKGEKRYKKLFDYSPSGPEFNFSEKAFFVAEKDLRFTLVSGEDLQKDKAIKTIYVGQ